MQDAERSNCVICILPKSKELDQGFVFYFSDEQLCLPKVNKLFIAKYEAGTQIFL